MKSVAASSKRTDPRTSHPCPERCTGGRPNFPPIHAISGTAAGLTKWIKTEYHNALTALKRNVLDDFSIPAASRKAKAITAIESMNMVLASLALPF